MSKVRQNLKTKLHVGTLTEGAINDVLPNIKRVHIQNEYTVGVGTTVIFSNSPNRLNPYDIYTIYITVRDNNDVVVSTFVGLLYRKNATDNYIQFEELHNSLDGARVFLGGTPTYIAFSNQSGTVKKIRVAVVRNYWL